MVDANDYSSSFFDEEQLIELRSRPSEDVEMMSQ